MFRYLLNKLPTFNFTFFNKPKTNDQESWKELSIKLRDDYVKSQKEEIIDTLAKIDTWVGKAVSISMKLRYYQERGYSDKELEERKEYDENLYKETGKAAYPFPFYEKLGEVQKEDYYNMYTKPYIKFLTDCENLYKEIGKYEKLSDVQKVVKTLKESFNEFFLSEKFKRGVLSHQPNKGYKAKLQSINTNYIENILPHIKRGRIPVNQRSKK